MPLGRRAKAAVLVAALLVLAVEGVLLVRYYDRYHGADAASAGSTVGSTVGSAPAFERTMPEGTASTEAPPSSADGATFVHRATDANSRGDYTYLSHPRIDGNPEAVVLVASPEGAGGGGYGHNVGVWFEPRKKKWAIFNQDLAPVPAGATFGVVIPQADRGFVHRAEPVNTEGNATYLDDPLTNGEPDAEVFVTQNWNPGGGNGVYNDHPTGVGYDEDVERWYVYNEDGARVPEGGAFNVHVTGSGESAR